MKDLDTIEEKLNNLKNQVAELEETLKEVSEKQDEATKEHELTIKRVVPCNNEPKIEIDFVYVDAAHKFEGYMNALQAINSRILKLNGGRNFSMNYENQINFEYSWDYSSNSWNIDELFSARTITPILMPRTEEIANEVLSKEEYNFNIVRNYIENNLTEIK